MSKMNWRRNEWDEKKADFGEEYAYKKRGGSNYVPPYLRKKSNKSVVKAFIIPYQTLLKKSDFVLLYEHLHNQNQKSWADFQNGDKEGHERIRRRVWNETMRLFSLPELAEGEVLEKARFDALLAAVKERAS